MIWCYSADSWNSVIKNCASHWFRHFLANNYQWTDRIFTYWSKKTFKCASKKAFIRWESKNETIMNGTIIRNISLNKRNNITIKLRSAITYDFIMRVIHVWPQFEQKNAITIWIPIYRTCFLSINVLVCTGSCCLSCDRIHHSDDPLWLSQWIKKQTYAFLTKQCCYCSKCKSYESFVIPHSDFALFPVLLMRLSKSNVFKQSQRRRTFCLGKKHSSLCYCEQCVSKDMAIEESGC